MKIEDAVHSRAGIAMQRPWLVDLAEAPGKEIRALLRPKKKQWMTVDERDAFIYWLAKIAGHWGNLTLGD